MGCLFQTAPSSVRDLCGRGRGNTVRARGGGDAKETASSREKRSDTQTNSQSLWQHSQNLHKFKPNKKSKRRGGDDEVLSPNQEVICNWYLLKKEKISSCQYGATVSINHSPGQAMHRKSWPTQNRFHSFVVCVLFLLCLIGIFFFLVWCPFFYFSFLFWERKRGWSWVGSKVGSFWEELEKDKYDPNIFCGNFLIN